MALEQVHSPTGPKLDARSTTRERGIGGRRLGASSDAARKHPWWVALFGVLLVLLGVIAIGAAVTTTLATALFFGVLMLVAGVAQLVDAFSTRNSADAVWRVVGGVLYLLVGGLIIFDPVEGAIGLTFLLATFFAVEGIYRMFLASRFASTTASKGWLFFSGLIGLILGALIWAEWPAAGTWIIGLFVGVELIFAGAALLLLAATRGKATLAS